MNLLHRGESVSLWLDTVEMPQFSPLEQDTSCDVCVIGAGLGGITTAYLLAREGKKVCVLESHEVGSGQTGRTTAHVVNALDDRYYEIERTHGKMGARLAADSHSGAIDLIEEITREEGISCDLERVNGYLFLGDGSHPETLYWELEAAHRAGLNEVALVERAPLPYMDTGEALLFPRQIQFHPLKYLRGLADCILRAGGSIYTHSHVVEVKGGRESYVKTRDGFTVHAQEIVVATNTPVNDLFAVHTKQAPYRTYVIGVRVPSGSVPKALYWDTEDPYHYIRLYASDLMIIGGEDHKTGQESHPEDRYRRLEEWTRLRFPNIGEVVYRWSGQVMEPVDMLGYLGRNPFDHENVYVITGDSGNGMTHCTIGAMLITDQILGRKNPWASIYSPSRVRLRATGTYLQENANVLAQYREYFTTGQAEFDEIPPGEGRVVRDGTKLIAAYRDETGSLNLRSAVCPHLGCIVTWNSAEKSWDCPCHGSRFDCLGQVEEGPAISDLRPVDARLPDAEERPILPPPRLRRPPNSRPRL